MQGPNALFQFQVSRLRGLDEQEHFLVLLHRILPAIHRDQPGYHIDAGRQLLLDQRLCNLRRLLAIRYRAQHHKLICRHAGNIPEQGGDRQAVWLSVSGALRYVRVMPSFPIVLLLFLLVPLLEIWLLIKVGGIIGALPTVALVVLTAVLGAALARQQGLATLQRLQASLARGEAPAVEMLEGVLLLIGALLLLTPGFFTDALGFACLIPPVRRALAWWAIRQFSVVTPAGTADGKTHPTHTIEGEFRREDD